MASTLQIMRTWRIVPLLRLTSTVAGNAMRRGLPKARRLWTVTHTYIRPQLIAVPIKFPAVVRHFGAGPEFTEEKIQQGTLEVVKLFDKVDASKVTLDAHFINDLGLDSLDVVELVMAFEDEFGVEISDEEAEKVFTVNDAVELLKKKLIH